MRTSRVLCSRARWIWGQTSDTDTPLFNRGNRGVSASEVWPHIQRALEHITIDVRIAALKTLGTLRSKGIPVSEILPHIQTALEGSYPSV
ncbi:MAG: hypothetical protein AAF706_03425, partial [Bacteroidota bacterium]